MGVRSGQKEVTAFWLSIWDGFFKVTIFISEKSRADALNLPLDDEIKQKVADSKQMGKIKFFPLIFDLRSDEFCTASDWRCITPKTMVNCRPASKIGEIGRIEICHKTTSYANTLYEPID